MIAGKYYPKYKEKTPSEKAHALIKSFLIKDLPEESLYFIGGLLEMAEEVNLITFDEKLQYLSMAQKLFYDIPQEGE